MTFQKWTDIKQFHDIWKNMNYFWNRQLEGIHQDEIEAFPHILYQAKIKLHGTNAAIRLCSDGSVVAQARNRDLTIDHDNYGFAAFVENLKKILNSKGIPETVIYGEFAGPGIQQSVAVSQIPKKVFAIFAIKWIHPLSEKELIVIHPNSIESLLSLFEINTKFSNNCYIIPWYESSPNNKFTLNIDLANPDATIKEVKKINDHVNKVEKEDPWVKKTFGISGTGEGLVFYPVKYFNKEKEVNSISYEIACRYIFKAKGEKHQVTTQKKPVIMTAEIANSIQEFVDKTVTQQRLDQGFQEGINGELDIRRMGDFIKWVNKDIIKECAAELGELDWKKVSSAVSKKAREYLLLKITQG